MAYQITLTDDEYERLSTATAEELAGENPHAHP